MSSNDGGPNISVGLVEGGQNNIGRTEIAGDQNQTNHFGEQELTIERFVAALPKEPAEKVGPELQALGNLSEEEQQSIVESDDPKWRSIVDKVKPYASTILKGVATFGAAALQSFAARNPIVAGVIAVCESHAMKKSSPPLS